MSEEPAAGGPHPGIHPTAIVDPGAWVAPSATVGPGSVIGPAVQIGAGTRVGSHVLIQRDTRVGEDCRISHGAALGTDPQDLKYEGEPTRLEIGSRTVIREFCTLNRGTAATGVTRVGADVVLMASVHVAHDCRIGDHVIVANAAQLGGHVEIGDWAVLGGLAGVHQFCRVGAHALVGGCSRVTQDIPPFLMAVGNPCALHGVNVVGLRRRGFTDDTVTEIRRAHRTIFRSRELHLGRAMDRLEAEGPPGPEVARLLAFIRASRRGVIT
ncbi:MAG: acyl-ACP--UDP-N-acetylglucosamine O-acyltransferase [Gemmatimonadota bacterium]|nr:acyl-ACP--UDP-N-acetylglucosamine O-acyltransferase [Gemmatimonadota bacterium]